VFSLKILVQVIEHGRAARQACLVIFMSHRNPGNQPFDTGRFLSPEFRILEIDVMDNLRDRGKRGIVEPYALEAGEQVKKGGNMKWVTRARPKVDRVACPWLIKRFVDPDAEFLYVPPEQVMDVAKREGAIPFDVAGVELGHKGVECSFDAIIKKYNITDPALQRLALIVRGADTGAKDLALESRGLEAIAEGFRLVYQDDHELLRRESSVYDALYAYCQSQKMPKT
jgi:hypothetical protein